MFARFAHPWPKLFKHVCIFSPSTFHVTNEVVPLLRDATARPFMLELKHRRQMLCLFNAKGCEACLNLISLRISIQRRFNTNVT